MGRAWIEDEKRPGGIGRSERERIFWERVASGRKPAAARGLRRSGPESAGAAAARRVPVLPGDASGASGPSRRAPGASADTTPDRAPDGAAVQLSESLEMAIVTMLTVVVFGLGWATLETERFALDHKSKSDVIAAETGYALPTGAVEKVDRN